MQAQWPPAPYVGLWTRARRLPPLDARARGAARRRPQADGHARHAPPRHGPRLSDSSRPRSGRCRRGSRRMHLERALRIVPEVRALVRDGRITHEEVLAHLRETGIADLTEIDWRRMVHAVRRHAHLLHARETAVWTTRPAGRLRASSKRRAGRRACGADRDRPPLPRRFRPGDEGDLADWSGLRVARLRARARRRSTLRRFRDEDGRELFDVPRAPLPARTRPRRCASCRSGTTSCSASPTGARVISDEIRQRSDRQERRRRRDRSSSTASSPRLWRRPKGTVRSSRLRPAARLAPRGRGRGGPTGGLAPLMQIGAHISSAGGIDKAIDRAVRPGRRVGAGLHAEPAHVAADEPRPGELRPLPREVRRGRDRRRPLPRRLPL